MLKILLDQTEKKLQNLKIKLAVNIPSISDDSLKEISFEEKLILMIEKEMSERKALVKKLVEEASFPYETSIDDIDYNTDLKVNLSAIQQLSSCSFIQQNQNIVVLGGPGSGKTSISCAIGNLVCQNGYSVKYYRIPELLLEIEKAKDEDRYISLMLDIQNTKLLILDDIGLEPYTPEESNEIMEIVERKYKRTSILLSGQISHDKWYELFPLPDIAKTFINKVIRNSYILPLLQRDSY